MVACVDEHPDFVFVPIADNRQHTVEESTGDGAEPSLRVSHWKPREQPEENPRPHVAETAAKGDSPREFPYPEDESIGMSHRGLRNPDNVLRRMLAIRIGGHHGTDRRKMIANPGDPRPQRNTLSAIDLVDQQDIHVTPNALKHLPSALFDRAVVDNNQMHEVPAEPRNQLHQLLIRLIGRDQYCHVGLHEDYSAQSFRIILRDSASSSKLTGRCGSKTRRTSRFANGFSAAKSTPPHPG